MRVKRWKFRKWFQKTGGIKETSSWKCLKEERRMGLYFKFFIVVTIINSFFLIFVWFLKLWLAVSTIHASYNMWKTKLTIRCDIWVVGCDGYPRGLLYVDTDTQAFQHWPRWCRPRFCTLSTLMRVAEHCYDFWATVFFLIKFWCSYLAIYLRREIMLDKF